MKKLLLFVLLSTFLFSHAQFLKYTDIAPMPEERSGVDATVYNGKIYIAGGFGSMGNYSNVLVYDIATNSYYKLDLAELGAIRYANIEVSGNKIYVFNGQKSDGTLNPYIWIHDTSTGNFTINQNPYPSRYAGSVVDTNGNIYFFGGSNQDETAYYNRLVKYVPSAGTFTLMANMPTPMEAKGEIVNNSAIYVFGGYNGSVLSSVYKYDTVQNTWTTTSLTVPNGISANRVVTDGNRFFLTGDYTNLTNNKIYEFQNYATGNDVHDISQSGMVGRRHHASVIVNNKLYIFGGNTGSSILTSAQVANLPMNIGMIGEFTNAWTYDVALTTTDGINYFYGSGSTPQKYTFAGTELKFRKFGDWGTNWGYTSFPTGTGLQDGPNIPIIQGSYYVYFNRNTGAYNFSTTFLGTHETNKEQALSFYPNPADDKIKFSKDIKDIKVYEMSGKEVKVVSLNKSEVSISGLSKGNYLMKVTTNDGNSYNQKLIKK